MMEKKYNSSEEIIPTIIQGAKTINIDGTRLFVSIFLFRYLFFNQRRDFFFNFWIVTEEGASRVIASAQFNFTKRVGGAGLADHTILFAQGNQLTFWRNTLVVENIKFSLFERCRDLVFDDLDPYSATDDFFSFFDLSDPADVQADRREEFQGLTARRGLGVAKHHPDLHPDLVDEDHHCIALGDDGGH